MAKEQKDPDNPTMEEILQTIRGVIAGEMDESDDKKEDEDILQLTEVAEAPASKEKLEVIQEDMPAAKEKIEVIKEDMPEPKEKLDIEREEQKSEKIDIEKEDMPAPKEKLEVEKEEAQEVEPLDILKEAIAERKSLDTEEKLVSTESVSESKEAMKGLLNNIQPIGPKLRSGATLDDLVVEALRPYLKEWLDKHLPEIVNRLVAKEIRRIVPEE